MKVDLVLNLIINGLPSIHSEDQSRRLHYKRFKPYYKWITFNTFRMFALILDGIKF